jgi:uncharacterized protein (DUF4415 family)
VTKGSTTRRYSAAELTDRRHGSRTDWARIRRQTDDEVDAAAAADPAWQDVPANWAEAAAAVMPQRKRALSIRLDEDVIDWFKERGPGYQTRINAVLRAFIEQQAKRRA